MSLTIEMRLNDQDFRRAMKRLKARAPFAIARALNRSIETARAAMVPPIAEFMGLSQSTVRDAMRIEQAVASSNKFVAKVHARGAAISLIKFAARGPEPSRGRGAGVTARIQGTRIRFRKAFIARMPNGTRAVFQRSTKKPMARMSRGAFGKNLPIFRRVGPSIPLVFHKFRDVGQKAGEAALGKNLRHEFKWLLQQSAQ